MVGRDPAGMKGSLNALVAWWPGGLVALADDDLYNGRTWTLRPAILSRKRRHENVVVFSRSCTKLLIMT